MATTLFFEGRVTSVPGSYSRVDASGLEQIGLGANGIVAVIGTAEGGKPVTAIEKVSDFIRISKPELARTTFKSGDLREVSGFLWEPAKDEDIKAGVQQYIPMKVNPATRSLATLANAQGNALDLTSRDYGAFTEQINVDVQSGTNKGKLLTIIFEDVTESVDDLGGDELFKLKYIKPTDGWDTMNTQVITGGSMKCDATRTVAGLDGDIGTTLAAPGAIEVKSNNAADVGMRATVYGLDGTGAAVSEAFTLAGTVAQVGTQVFAAGDVLGIAIEGTTVGTVTVEPSGGGAAVFSVVAGADPVAGLVRGVTMYVSASEVDAVLSAAGTPDVILVGTNSSGAIQLEKFTMTGTAPVNSVAKFSTIHSIVLGDVAAATNVILSAEAAKANVLVQTTLQKAADYFNGRSIAGTGGFLFTLVTGMTTFLLADLDETPAAVGCLDPAEPSFYADLWSAKNWINQNSQLISAEFATGATGGALSNTAAPVFLFGGIEGVATFTEWQLALNLLKQIRVNTIVVMTPDPAVHAALDAHCAYMGGIGRNERDGFVGIYNVTTGAPATKTFIKEAIVDLNTRHIRACAQHTERFNTEGERIEWNPSYEAAVGAGMQAGSPVGTSLTHKYANVLAFRQDNSWNPTDDSEEMVQAGLLFLENVEGTGRRFVRNITTHLSSNNIAYTEGSVNEAVNFSAYTFRTNMEFAVGKRGFSGTVNAAKGVAINTLGLLVDEAILVAYKGLNVDLAVDVIEVETQMAPVIPINFVKNTIHLVTIRQSAA